MQNSKNYTFVYFARVQNKLKQFLPYSSLYWTLTLGRLKYLVLSYTWIEQEAAPQRILRKPENSWVNAYKETDRKSCWKTKGFQPKFTIQIGNGSGTNVDFFLTSVATHSRWSYVTQKLFSLNAAIWLSKTFGFMPRHRIIISSFYCPDRLRITKLYN